MENKFLVPTGFDYFVKSKQVLDFLQHQSMRRIVVEVKFEYFSSTRILYQEFIEVKEAVKMLPYVSILL